MALMLPIVSDRRPVPPPRAQTAFGDRVAAQRPRHLHHIDIEPIVIMAVFPCMGWLLGPGFHFIAGLGEDDFLLGFELADVSNTQFLYSTATPISGWHPTTFR